MRKVIRRNFQLPEIKGKSFFIWGPRRTGKSYWLRNNFKPKLPIQLIDLLKTDTFAEYASRPALLRERVMVDPAKVYIIDEIQKIPGLLDEVHWLIENQGTQFILTGSSSRKLRR